MEHQYKGLEVGIPYLMFTKDTSIEKVESLFNLKYGEWPEQVIETKVGIFAGPVPQEYRHG